MGRWAYYQGISPKLLDELVADPRLVTAVQSLGRIEAARAELDAASPEQRERILRGRRQMEMLRSVFRAEIEREAWGLGILRDRGFTTADLTECIDIEKRWRALHEALESLPAPWRPLGRAVTGGVEIGEDLGYGPLRYFLPSDVASLASDLARLSSLEVVARGDEGDDYVREALETVRRCYAEAAARGFGMLLHFG